MNKMLILLFSIVSLSIGSCLAENATEEAPTAPLCYAFDGCTDSEQPGGRGPPGSGWKEGNLRPGFFDCAKKMGAIICCSMDGKSPCSRKDSKNVCRSGTATGKKDDEWKVTWNDAKKHCEDDGMRLCETQEELDQCCMKGCQYDNALVWSNVNKVGDVLGLIGLLPGTSGVVPGVIPECLVYNDCEGNKWCKNGVCTERK